MPSAPDPHDDPAITGVPDETPADVRSSATGLVAGPLDAATDVEVGEIDASTADDAVLGLTGSGPAVAP